MEHLLAMIVLGTFLYLVVFGYIDHYYAKKDQHEEDIQQAVRIGNYK